MRFAATFSPGFESIAARAVARETGAPVEHVRVSEGLIRFDSSAPVGRVAGAPCLAGVFVLFREFGGSPTFEKMVCASGVPPLPKGVRARSFRVRFSRANRFEGVPRYLLDTAERGIARATGLRPDRLGADVEFWYALRSEGGGFFGLLLGDPRAPKPEKGELRPSLAAMAAECAGVKSGDVVLDPFAGHGALPLAACRIARGVRPLCVERDRALIPFLERRFSSVAGAKVVCGDARSLPFEDGSVDLVLTDPPWGLFRETDMASLASLYRDALREASRVLKVSGRMAVLTARDFDLEALMPEGWRMSRRADTLVGGKKATVRVFTREK